MPKATEKRQQRRKRERDSSGGSADVSSLQDFMTEIRGLLGGTNGGGAGAATAGINEALMRDNFRYRERHREDQEIIADLEENQVPDGAVLIPPERAKALGIAKPEDVDKLHEDLGKLRSESTKGQRRKITEAAAAAMGWSPDVLGNLPGMGDHRLEIRQEIVKEGDTKTTVQVPYIIPPGEGAAAERLEEYVGRKTEWAPFAPALEAAADDDEGGDTGGETAPKPATRTAGTPFPKMKAKGSKGDGKTDPADAFIEKVNKRATAGNPLRPARTE